MRTTTPLVAAAGLCAAFMAATEAAALDCDTLPSPVYGRGANAVKPILKRLGQALAQAPSPETIIYQAPGQCFGINSLLDGEPLTGTASYWDATGTEQTCDLPVLGVDVEFAAMNSTATLCPGIDELPAGYEDFLGPVQSFDFIVPEASSQTTISAEAAYFVFGFGDQGQAAPWTDESQIFIRDANSGVSLFVALAISRLCGRSCVSSRRRCESSRRTRRRAWRRSPPRLPLRRRKKRAGSSKRSA